MRRLDDDAWFLVDDEWDVQRSQARALLTTRRNEVLAGSTTSEIAAAVTAELDSWLAARHPELRSGRDVPADGRNITPRTPSVGGTGLDLLGAARAEVADDLCVLVPAGDGWILAAGAVCFPSLWRLREKVHRPLDVVHETVPGYAGPLASRVDGFLDRSAPRRGAWRRNWSIHADDELFIPDHVAIAVLPPPEARVLRSERQTLRRLRGVDAVLFTIRTQQVPLSAVRARPDVCASLAAAIRGWTPAQRVYKGHAVDEALLEWLDAVR